MTEGGASDLRARLARALADRFTLGDLLGRGGFAEVWKAHEVALDRDVAVKVLRPELAEEPDVAERFLREARAMAKLAHPHIVQIHATGEHDGLVWVAMQFVAGETLRARLEREGALTSDEARRILDETAQALGAAHAAGIIHRDIKPDNILLDRDGHVRLSDFGIARAADATGQTLTGTGLIIGTPQYMSPEQGGAETVDHRSDLYSLGAVGYQLLAGRPPFQAENVLKLLMQHATEVPPSLAEKRPDAPGDLVAAIERCLRKRPDDRCPSAEDFRQAMRRNSFETTVLVSRDDVPKRKIDRPFLVPGIAGGLLAVSGVTLELLVGSGGVFTVSGVVAGTYLLAVTWGTRFRVVPATPATSGRSTSSIQRLRADRAAVLTILARLPKAEQEALRDARRAMDDLVTRAGETVQQEENTPAGAGRSEEAGILRARHSQDLDRYRSAAEGIRRAVRRVWADGHARAADDVAQALGRYQETVRREA